MRQKFIDWSYSNDKKGWSWYQRVPFDDEGHINMFLLGSWNTYMLKLIYNGVTLE